MTWAEEGLVGCCLLGVTVLWVYLHHSFYRQVSGILEDPMADLVLSPRKHNPEMP